MIRAVASWLRLVWPPGWIVAIAVGLGLVMLGLDYGIAWLQGTSHAGRDFVEIRGSIVLVMSMLYGGYRVILFLPLLRQGYGAWLASTPWTSAKPLPMGPLHLVWQDVAAAAILYALACDVERFSRAAAPLVLLIAYLLVLGLTFSRTDVKWATYVTAFGLGLAFRLVRHPLAAACVLLLLYAVLRWAIHLALKRFPWERPEWLERLEPRGKTRRTAENSLGWPFVLLRPEPPVTGINYSDATLMSLLLAWWLYALLSVTLNEPGLPPLDIAPFWAPFGVWCVGCFVVRVVLYCANYRAPISLWGRIFTLRWIIPGYDQVLVAPICAVTLGILSFWGLPRIGLPVTIDVPCAFFILQFVTLAMGPSRREWALTGSHRVAPRVLNLNRQEFVEL